MASLEETNVAHSGLSSLAEVGKGDGGRSWKNGTDSDKKFKADADRNDKLRNVVAGFQRTGVVHSGLQEGRSQTLDQLWYKLSKKWTKNVILCSSRKQISGLQRLSEIYIFGISLLLFFMNTCILDESKRWNKSS